MATVYATCGKAAAWLGTTESSPTICASITLTEADLRNLWAHMDASHEVRLSVGLFDNQRYTEGSKAPVYTGEGSIKVSCTPVVAKPQEAQAKQRVVTRAAKAALAPAAKVAPTKVVQPTVASPDLAAIVAAVIAAMPKASPAAPKAPAPKAKTAPKGGTGEIDWKANLPF